MRTIFKSTGMKSLEEIEKLKEEAKEFFQGCALEITDEDIQRYILEYECDEYNEAERFLDKELEGNILCIANLGLWNGRVTAAKILSNNLKEILHYFGCDDLQVYLNRGNILSKGIHHDGCNIYVFREIKDNVNIENFIDRILEKGMPSRSLLNYYTKPLGGYIQQIYGG